MEIAPCQWILIYVYMAHGAISIVIYRRHEYYKLNPYGWNPCNEFIAWNLSICIIHVILQTWRGYFQSNKVKYRYNAVYFILVTQSRCPIRADPQGQDMGRQQWFLYRPMYAICGGYARCHYIHVLGRVLSRHWTLYCFGFDVFSHCTPWQEDWYIRPRREALTSHMVFLRTNGSVLFTVRFLPFGLSVGRVLMLNTQRSR